MRRGPFKGEHPPLPAPAFPGERPAPPPPLHDDIIPAFRLAARPVRHAVPAPPPPPLPPGPLASPGARGPLANPGGAHPRLSAPIGRSPARVAEAGRRGAGASAVVRRRSAVARPGVAALGGGAELGGRAGGGGSARDRRGRSEMEP